MGFPFPLDLDRRITLAFSFYYFRLGSRVRCFCLSIIFLGLGSSFASVLLFASLCGFLLLCGFPSLGIFLASPCGPFRYRFFFWLSFVVVARCVLCTSLTLVFHFVVLGSPPVACWSCVLLALLPSLFWLGSSFLLSRVFSSSCLGFSVGLPRVFLSCAIAFLSSSRILLLCRGSLCALFFSPLSPFGDCLFLSSIIFLSSVPVSGYLPRPSFGLSLVSSLFFSCLVFLFCALPSGPPGVSPVTALSSAGHPPSLSSALAASSSPSFGFSPLASVFWGCSPLGGVSLRSGNAGTARLLVILPVQSLLHVGPFSYSWE